MSKLVYPAGCQMIPDRTACPPPAVVARGGFAAVSFLSFVMPVNTLKSASAGIQNGSKCQNERFNPEFLYFLNAQQDDKLLLTDCMFSLSGETFRMNMLFP